jgi:hypothetical protein
MRTPLSPWCVHGCVSLACQHCCFSLNPNTNRLSPQFHCVFDNYFETVQHEGTTPPPMWEDLVINSRFCNDINNDVDDTWDTPVPMATPAPVASSPVAPPPGQLETPPTATIRSYPSPERLPTSPPVSVPIAPTPSPVESAPMPPPAPAPSPSSPDPSGPRRSTRVCKPVERFTPDKTHGYRAIRCFATRLVTCLCLFSSQRQVYDVNYATATEQHQV